MGMNLQETLLNHLEEPITFEGVDLVDLEITGTGGQKTLVIYIDKAGGVTVDDCEKISRKVSVLLDVHDLIPFSYRLEVSSPGLDRPLKTKKDFMRHKGAKVSFSVNEPVNGSHKVTGTILDVEEEGIKTMVGKKEMFLPFSIVIKAAIVIDF